MSNQRFLFQLILITLLTGFVLFFLHIFQPFAPYRLVSFAGLVFFAALSAGIYFPSSSAAKSSDKNAFTRLVMIFTFVKMFLTVALVLAYHRIFKPTDNLFLIPFFLNYIVFTSFETIFMSKLGKLKPQ